MDKAEFYKLASEESYKQAVRSLGNGFPSIADLEFWRARQFGRMAFRAALFARIKKALGL